MQRLSKEELIKRQALLKTLKKVWEKAKSLFKKPKAPEKPAEKKEEIKGPEQKPVEVKKPKTETVIEKKPETKVIEEKKEKPVVEKEDFVILTKKMPREEMNKEITNAIVKRSKIKFKYEKKNGQIGTYLAVPIRFMHPLWVRSKDKKNVSKVFISNGSDSRYEIKVKGQMKERHAVYFEAHVIEKNDEPHELVRKFNKFRILD